MAESINVLRDIEKCYTTKDSRCMTNFETADEYEELRRTQTSPSLFQKDLKEIRRAAKTHFTTDTDDMKLSTIHSFKGWESESVILILQPEMSINDRYDGYYIQERENIPALIYTALTRAKCNLFILNVGNTKYHSFFQTNIRQ
jgi:superfamily I DNA/RNA helicase